MNIRAQVERQYKPADDETLLTVSARLAGNAAALRLAMAKRRVICRSLLYSLAEDLEDAAQDAERDAIDASRWRAAV